MREFRKLWLGQSVSAVGSSITVIALPLTAAFTLAATPQQMGFLSAASWIPYLLFALFAGAWSDRLRRKPILIACDIGRAAVLVTIPLAALAGRLTIQHVLIAAFVAGSLTVLFQSAYRPFIPFLVGRDAIVEANSKVALSESVARVLGPSLGGLLVQLLTAPIAILADAVSFVVSAVTLLTVRAREEPPARDARRSIWTEIAEGMRVVVSNPFIRSVAVIGIIFNLAITTGDTIYILYATRVLGLDAALVGAVYTVGGVAAVAGATLVNRTTRRFGIGPAMVGAIFCIAAAWALVLAAAGPPIVAALYLAGRSALAAFGAAVFNVTTSSVYQAAVPDRVQGRVGGAGQVLGLGLIPVAALAGGWLGEHVGLWNTLAISLGLQLLGLVYVVSSPLRRIRTASDLGPLAGVTLSGDVAAQSSST
jgi:MFS family permease